MRTSTRTTIAALVLAAAACGGGDEVQTAAEGGAAEAPATTAPTPEPDDTGASAEADGCPHIDAGLVSAAFDGTVEITAVEHDEAKGRCRFSYAGGVDGMAYTEVTVDDGLSFERYAAGAGGMEPEPVDGLGAEAYRIGDVQLHVLLDDGRSVMVATQFLTDGEVPFDDELARTASESIAEQVLREIGA